MQMLIKIFIFAVTVIMFSLPVNAEQPAAEKYRQMFQSGNFFVEYRIFRENYIPNWEKTHKEESASIILAGKDGQRVLRQSNVRTGGNPIIFHASGFLPKSHFAGNELIDENSWFNSQRIDNYLMEYKNKCPDVLYRDGKYYRFIKHGLKKDEVFGIVLSEEDLNNPYLEPYEEWNYVKEDLALPNEIAIFYWNDPCRDNSMNIPVPHYNGNSKRVVDNKEYDCDQYISEIKSLAGNVIAIEAYNMLYDKNELAVIQKYLIRDGKEYLSRTIKIKSITSEVPESAFEIGKKVEIFAASKGDMTDLLEKKNLVETLGVK